MKNACIAALRRRLEKWELPHLRSHAADLHQQLEACQQELERVRDELYNASRVADFWCEAHHELADHLAEQGEAIGLSKDGHIGIVDLRAEKCRFYDQPCECHGAAQVPADCS